MLSKFWKRFWIVFLSLAVLLLGTYLVWDHQTKKILEEKIAEIRASGAPTEPG